VFRDNQVWTQQHMSSNRTTTMIQSLVLLTSLDILVFQLKISIAVSCYVERKPNGHMMTLCKSHLSTRMLSTAWHPKFKLYRLRISMIKQYLPKFFNCCRVYTRLGNKPFLHCEPERLSNDITQKSFNTDGLGKGDRNFLLFMFR